MSFFMTSTVLADQVYDPGSVKSVAVRLHPGLIGRFETAPIRWPTTEAMGAIGRVSIEEIGGKTHLMVRIECGSSKALDRYLQMGIAAGRPGLSTISLPVSTPASSKYGLRGRNSRKGGAMQPHLTNAANPVFLAYVITCLALSL
jgi:hypothetical protein